jgi:hypothetical protein
LIGRASEGVLKMQIQTSISRYLHVEAPNFEGMLLRSPSTDGISFASDKPLPRSQSERRQFSCVYDL